MKRHIVAMAGLALAIWTVPGQAEGNWLDRRPIVAHSFLAGHRVAPTSQDTVVGTIRTHQVVPGDTFVDLARHLDLGYNEILMANPGVDPWVPTVGTHLVLPSEWILPDTRHAGLVMNIPEMRLYYYEGSGSGAQVYTFPVGLGRQEWRTPQGGFRIAGKTKNPVWVIPETIRKERFEEDGSTERSIAGGIQQNPLGKHRIELTLPSYAIHGTNKEYGVGMSVSHGCVRMYPEDIASFFPIVKVGSVGEFVYQTVKVGTDHGRILIEVHDDIYEMGVDQHAEAEKLLAKLGVSSLVDPLLLRAAIQARSGIPTDIGMIAGDGEASAN
ncbi:MAG: L,D-transpeptidase ErfK/SrfK [Hyphomicrobiaceae bacterium]|jgi:L,D-transpeptidase ErfK/SrfK